MLLTFTALFWAGNSIVARGARELVPPVALAFWRWAIALCVILPFAWRHVHEDLSFLRRQWPIVVLLGTLGIAAFNALLYTGLQDTSALNAMLLQSGQPSLILLVGVIAMRDRTSWRQIAGAAIAMVGVGWIVSAGRPARLAALHFNQGDLIVGLAVVLWSVYSVMLRRRPSVHPLSLFAATLVVGVAVIAPFYALELAAGRTIVLVPESAAAIAYVSIFPSVLAYLFFNRGVELIGSAATGMYMNIMPLLGAGLAIIFLGEPLHSFHVASMGIILFGIAVAGRGSAPIVAQAEGRASLHR